ncbi:MAG: threonine synthase, partial [Corynebacterium casei]|nr:threonine synthase [Corynebacterium casei]
MAQIVYYINCWLKVTESNEQKVSFSVPTGNFGDICAAHIARQMGLPIDRLIVATNENNVLDEFFRTGNYRPRPAEETLATSSPSMDISRASNFERFVFDLVGRDAGKVADLFGTKIKEGGFVLDADLIEKAREEFGFVSSTSKHSDRLATIKDVNEKFNYLVDPHTADGVKAARDAQTEYGVETAIIVLETALPVKFSETIEEAIGTAPQTPERFATILDADRFVTDLPNDVGAVKDFITSSIASVDVK